MYGQQGGRLGLQARKDQGCLPLRLLQQPAHQSGTLHRPHPQSLITQRHGLPAQLRQLTVSAAGCQDQRVQVGQPQAEEGDRGEEGASLAEGRLPAGAV